MHWVDGSSYKGYWRCGIQHGTGELITKKNKTLRGYFQDNIYVGGFKQWYKESALDVNGNRSERLVRKIPKKRVKGNHSFRVSEIHSYINEFQDQQARRRPLSRGRKRQQPPPKRATSQKISTDLPSITLSKSIKLSEKDSELLYRYFEFKKKLTPGEVCFVKKKLLRNNLDGFRSLLKDGTHGQMSQNRNRSRKKKYKKVLRSKSRFRSV